MQHAARITLKMHLDKMQYTTLKRNMFCVILSLLMLTACSSQPAKAPTDGKSVKKSDTVERKAVVRKTQAPIIIQQECPIKEAPAENVDLVIPPAEKPPAKASSGQNLTPDFSLLSPSDWQSIEDFQSYNLVEAWPAWLHSCSALVKKTIWKAACQQAKQLDGKYAKHPTSIAIQSYFQRHFSVYQANNADGSRTGLITGYYQPKLNGSRTKSAKYRYPLYLEPDDLVTVKLEGLYPALKHKRIRGRLVGNELVPYYSRAEIATQPSPIQSAAFVYIDDIIDVFFLQIQGSGLVQLDTGEQMHVGYANQNGHSYRSIGRVLIHNKQLKPSEASMNGIKNWARKHPNQLRKLLNSNPSFVFFRELPKGLPGPLGALGVPLLAEQAVAVDKKHIPMGAPVFLSTTQPNSQVPLKKFMMAQDTGGAIKGGVRADFYWGAGDAAGRKAGAMKQDGEIWVLLPKGFNLPK